MAIGTIWDAVTFSKDAAWTTNGVYTLATSADLSNANPKETSVHVVVNFDALTPDGTVGGVGAAYGIAALVEGKYGDSWRLIGSDNTPIKDTGDGPEHHITIIPGYAGNEADASIGVFGQRGFQTRFDGKVPDTFRVCLHIELEDAGGPGDFVSCVVSAHYETFTP